MCSETTSLTELKICKDTLLRSNSTNNEEGFSLYNKESSR